MRRYFITGLMVLICAVLMSLAWPLNIIYKSEKKNDVSDLSDIVYLSCDSEVVQQFIAPAQRLKYINIYFGERTGEMSGKVHIKLSDNSGELLSERTIAVSNIKSNGYNKVTFRQKLHTGKKYKLSITIDKDSYTTLGVVNSGDSDEINHRLYLAGSKRKGALACIYIFSSELNRNQTLAYWGILIVLLFVCIILTSRETIKLFRYKLSLRTAVMQICIIAGSIIMFLLAALFSYVIYGRNTVLSPKVIMICILSVVFLVFVVKDFRYITANIRNMRCSVYLIILIIYSVIIRVPMLANLQRWDAGEYYYRLGMACSSFDLSFSGFFSDFRLCGHSNLGFSFLMSFPEFIFPRNIIAMNVWNLMLTVSAIVCLYWLIRDHWMNLTDEMAAITTAVITSVPLFLGTFSYFNVDYIMVLVFIYMAYCDHKDLHFLCAWNTILLSQIKETGVVIVAGYWGLKILVNYIHIIRTKAGLAEKLRGMIQSKSLWMIFTSGTLYMFCVIIIGGISGWTQNAEEDSAIGWSNDGFNCFGFKPEYILYKLKQLFVMNFNWVWFLGLIICAAILLLKIISKKKSAVGKDGGMTGVLGAAIGFTAFSCLYITYALSRYNIIMAVLLPVLCVYILSRLIASDHPVLYRNVMAGMFILMLVQTFYNIDPVSSIIFDKVNIGEADILYSDYGNVYYGDGLVTNYQYTWLDKAYDKMLRMLNYRTGDVIIIPGPEWEGSHIVGNDAIYGLQWDPERRRRTFANTGSSISKIITNDLDYVVGFENKWYDNYYTQYKKALITYVPYYDIDVLYDLRRFRDVYYIGDEQSAMVYGGTVTGFNLYDKEEYAGLSVSDTMSEGGYIGQYKDIGNDLMDYMKNAGWSENLVEDYARALDVRSMKIIEEESTEEIIDKYDIINADVSVMNSDGVLLSASSRLTRWDYDNLVVGSGIIGKAAEEALIGHFVGDEVEVDIDIPEMYSDVRALCGDRMKMIIYIDKKTGRVDPRSLSEDTQLDNYKEAYSKVWDVYYKQAVRQMLIDVMGTKPDEEEESLLAAVKKVNKYFADYCAYAQMPREEYVTHYLKISEEQFGEAEERLAWSYLIRKKIDEKEKAYKEEQLEIIEKNRYIYFY